MRCTRSIVLTGLVGFALAAGLPVLASPARAVAAQDNLVFVGGPTKAKFADVVTSRADGTGQRVVRKGTLKQAPWYADLAPVTNRIVEIYGDGSKEDSPSNLAVMNLDGSNFRTLVHGTSKADISLARWNSTGTKILVSVITEQSGYLAVLDTTAPHPALVRIKGSTGLADAAFANTSDNTIAASDESGAIVTLAGGKTTLVLDPPMTGFFDTPVFSPDDGTIVFSALSFMGSSVVSRIQTISADGVHGPDTLVDSGLNLVPNWSSDGNTVFYNVFNMKSGFSQPYSVASVPGSAASKLSLKTGSQYLLGGVAAPDSTAPAAATSLHVRLNGAAPTLGWTMPADSDVSHVVVRRTEGTVAPSGPTDGVAVYSGSKPSTPDAVTAGSTYTYGVWVVDGAGNFSPVATHTFQALSAPKLSSPPLVSAFSVDTTFHVGWAPTSANPDGTTYTVQWQSSGGTWQTWQDAVTTTSARFGDAGVPLAPVAGKTYALRAFTTDAYGNTSAKSAVMWVEPRDDAAAKSRGTWKTSSSSAAWLGTASTTTQAKASLSIGLTGKRIWIIGGRQLLGSKAEVYVDGVKVATIDTHGSPAQRHVLWTHTVKAGKHTVRIVNLATKGRVHLAIDGFAAL